MKTFILQRFSFIKDSQHLLQKLQNIKNKQIVINNCYGYFGLSQKGRSLYKELSGKDFDAIKVKRDNPDLIRVIRILGKKADGDLQDLRIVEVPDPYQIISENGKERVIKGGY